MASPTTSPARPDARVQHVNLQFGKESGMHLQFASTARERLAMKRTTFLAFFLSHGGGRETFGLCIVAQRNVEPGWVMPAGYIEPRKIVFHRRRVPHQTCGMNWPQELPEHSQILPRKPSRLRQVLKTPCNHNNEIPRKDQNSHRRWRICRSVCGEASRWYPRSSERTSRSR